MPQRPISATISVEPSTPITAEIPAIVDSLLDLYREYTGNPEASLAELFADLTGADGTTPSLRLSGTVLEVLVDEAWQPLGDVGGPPGQDGADGLPGADGADSTVPGPKGDKGDPGDPAAFEAALSEHEQATDPHPGYATDGELTAGLAGKAPSSHSHTITQVTGLQAALDARIRLTRSDLQAGIDAAAAAGERYLSIGTSFTTPGVTLPSGFYLVSNGGKLTLASGAPASSALIRMTGSDSGIVGHLELDGNRPGQSVADTNFGQAGLDIKDGAANITIDSVRAVNFTRDGVYIGGTSPVRSVKIGKLVSDGSGRNGVSITNAQELHIGYLEAINTLAGVTGDGLDAECNNVGDSLRSIVIDTLVARNNARNGAQIFGRTVEHGGVTIGVLNSFANGGDGLVLYVCSRVKILEADVYQNALNGLRIPRDVRNIRIKGDFWKNGQRGISGALTVQSVPSYLWDFTGSRCYNNSQAAPGTNDGARFDSDSDAFPLLRVLLRGAALYDDQATPTQRYGLTSGTANTRVDRIRAEAFSYGNIQGAGFANGANSSFTSL